MLYVSGERSLGNEIALSWTESLGPRPMIRNHGTAQNKASDLEFCRAAYRNRTDDLRITRGMRPGCAYSDCTDSTGNRTDSTRGAGIIRGTGPRTGPRPRPCVPAIPLLYVNVADDQRHLLHARREYERFCNSHRPTRQGEHSALRSFTPPVTDPTRIAVSASADINARTGSSTNTNMSPDLHG